MDQVINGGGVFFVFFFPPLWAMFLLFLLKKKKMGHTMQFCTWLFSLEAASTSAYNIYPLKKNYIHCFK